MLKKYRELKRTLAKLHYLSEQDKDFILSQGVTDYSKIKVKMSHKNNYADKVDKIVDTRLLSRAKLKELEQFKSDLDLALVNYHNHTFKAILRLYVFDNVSVKKIAEKYGIAWYTVNNIIDVAFKQVCRPKDNKQIKEQDKIHKITSNLSAYDYDCLINCRRDFILPIKDIAKIHKKAIYKVAENVARLEEELYDKVRIKEDYDYMSNFEYNKQLLQSSRSRIFYDEEDLETILKRLYGID